ncbi:MAG: hypothetical protein NC253_01345 [Ruminococcus sp.]|nr:hypothetical protein [Ruminococcus sp.]MCM1380930.1 hypothetical protein [Muribaculaceae bacterium]MCM1480483.1 hypothetical protein [Muribaculaceae bacterium]
MILDKPFTQQEFEEELRMLDGSKNRICVTHDVGELFIQLNSAVTRLNLLAYSRYLELKDKKE